PAERFASAFADRIGKWCDTHRIALTGHLLGEGTLHSQTRGVGEAMRPLRSFQIPGIDVLADKMELVTAKQAQSIARQFGRRAMLSELYGVTNWDFDFVGHKAQGDWQAACGVSVRVPHLAWLSMAGEAKRDYPASTHTTDTAHPAPYSPPGTSGASYATIPPPHPPPLLPRCALTPRPEPPASHWCEPPPRRLVPAGWAASRRLGGRVRSTCPEAK